MKNPIPQKLVVEVRYPSSLKFNSQIVDVGLSLSERYPKFKKSIHELQVWSERPYRSVFLSSSKWAFELDIPTNIEEEVSELLSVSHQISEVIAPEVYNRIGVRSWFTFKIPEDFRSSVVRFHRRFHRDETLGDALGINATICDTSFVVDFELDEWKGHLSSGPMRQEEWFSRFNPKGDLEKHMRKDLPDRFLFVDVDLFKENLPAPLNDDDFRYAFAMASKVANNQFLRYKT